MPITIHVQNFQSIEDATLVVDGLTSITGGNNIGKSAFFRAVRGLCCNAPGHDFVRHGAEFSHVEMRFDDDSTVTWEKGKKINRYQVNGGKWMENVGKGVPPEVVDVLGVHPIMAASRTLWPQISRQFVDTMFLLAPDMPGSVLAEAIADVERVGRINKALKASEKDLRSVHSTLKVRLKDQTRFAEELVPYKALDDIQTRMDSLGPTVKKARRIRRGVSELERIQVQLDREAEIIADLSGVEAVVMPSDANIQDALDVAAEIRSVERLKSQFDHEKGVAERLSGVDEVDLSISSLAEATALWGQVQEGESIFAEVESLRDEVLSHEEALEAFEGVDLSDDHHERIARKAERAHEVVARLAKELIKVTGQVIFLESEIEGLDQKIEGLTEFIGNELEGLEECPVCGSVPRHEARVLG